MSTQVDNAGSDNIRLLSALGLLLVALFGYYWFSDLQFWYRVLGFLLLFASSVYLVFTTEKGRLLLDFMRGARVEVRKVVWPTRQETMQTTLIIFIAVIVAGIFFWVVDSILLWVVKLLTGQVG